MTLRSLDTWATVLSILSKLVSYCTSVIWIYFKVTEDIMLDNQYTKITIQCLLRLELCETFWYRNGLFFTYQINDFVDSIENPFLFQYGLGKYKDHKRKWVNAYLHGSATTALPASKDGKIICCSGRGQLLKSLSKYIKKVCMIR